MNKIMLTILIMMLILILYSSSPFSLMISIIMQTIIISINSSLINNSFWFSYILILTFLSGILILFIYMTIITSNKMIFINLNQIIMLMTTLTMIFMFSNLTTFIPNYLNLEYNSFINSIEMKNLMFNNTKLFNKNSNFLCFVLMNYLFLMLFVSNKIINAFYGPMRMSNY